MIEKFIEQLDKVDPLLEHITAKIDFKEPIDTCVKKLYQTQHRSQETKNSSKGNFTSTISSLLHQHYQKSL